MIYKKIESITARYSSLGIEFFWVIAAQLFMLAGGLVTIKLLSNLLSKQEFGIYALLFSIVSLLVSVLYSPLGQVNMRFLVLARQQGFVEKFKSDIRKLQLLISSISLLALVPVAYFLTIYSGSGFLTYSALALLTVMIGIQTSQQYLLMAFRLRREGSTAQMIGAIGRPLLVFVVLTLFGYFALSAVYGLAIGFFILVLTQFFFLNKSWKTAIHEDGTLEDKVRTTASQPANREYFSYGSVYMLIGLVTVVVLNTDRWLLSVLGSFDQVAIYAALMQIAQAPVAFGHAILTRLAAPIFFKAINNSRKDQNDQFRILLAFWAALGSAILIASLLFHYQIVVLLTNASFAAYSYLLPWMVLGLMLERGAQIFELKGSMLLNTGIYVYPRLLTIILVPGLEYLCLQFLGFDWLVAGLIGATTASLLCIVLVNRIQLNW